MVSGTINCGHFQHKDQSCISFLKVDVSCRQLGVIRSCYTQSWGGGQCHSRCRRLISTQTAADWLLLTVNTAALHQSLTAADPKSWTTRTPFDSVSTSCQAPYGNTLIFTCSRWVAEETDPSSSHLSAFSRRRNLWGRDRLDIHGLS